MTGFRALAAGAAVVALVTACAGPAHTVPTPLPVPSETAAHEPSGPGIAPSDGGLYPLLPATHPHVQLTCPLIGAIHYDPARIPPAEVDGVYICTAEPWTPAPDGTPQLVQYVDRVAQEDVLTLLTVYTLPDTEPTDENCIMSLQDPLIVWIHAGEKITPVYAPRDVCGFSSDVAADAYHAVELHRLLVAREKETRD